ncbi:plasma membrane proteolipid 3 [Diplocarpon rosae]|nr:plasma membrane proteolipid 3 [Diplocarpon rosae]
MSRGNRASDICKIILAIVLPPLGVFLERGCGADLLINILLTILGYIPGIIHALYVLLSPLRIRTSYR